MDPEEGTSTRSQTAGGTFRALCHPCRAAPALTAQDLDPSTYRELRYRHIGPEGNRVIAIAGHPGNRDLIYAGAASGGIWKMSDGGLNWVPIFDQTDVASIGALAVSNSDPNVIWAGTGETNIRSMISIGNGIYKSTDGGYSWREISGDLTTDDETKQVDSGGLTFDNVGVDYGTALFAIAESPLDPQILWAGSNDGLIHVTRDGGGSWTNVTINIEGLPQWGTVSNIEPSRFAAGSAYITVDFHQVNDRAPYVYRTKDFGASWVRITDNIPLGMLSYAHVVKEDPERAGMLYLGTENTVYLSFDEGDHWLPLRNNLPPAPVHWLTVQERFGDLVLGTYGRGFWILDDLSPLRQLTGDVLASDVHLFEPRATYRLLRRNLPGERVRGSPSSYREDPPYGASINYYLATDADAATLSIRDETGKMVRVLRGSGPPGTHPSLRSQYGGVWTHLFLF